VAVAPCLIEVLARRGEVLARRGDSRRSSVLALAPRLLSRRRRVPLNVLILLKTYLKTVFVAGL
jgi:hypothetical protein